MEEFIESYFNKKYNSKIAFFNYFFPKHPKNSNQQLILKLPYKTNFLTQNSGLEPIINCSMNMHPWINKQNTKCLQQIIHLLLPTNLVQNNTVQSYRFFDHILDVLKNHKKDVLFITLSSYIFGVHLSKKLSLLNAIIFHYSAVWIYTKLIHNFDLI